MKKLLFLAALSSVALTSCVNEELENVETQPVLKFDVPALSQTKANVLGEVSGTTYPEGEDFVVYCKSYTGKYKGWDASDDATHYFNANGETATPNSTVGTAGGKYWSTSTVHYWPEVEYSLAFAAYSPAVLSTASSAAPSSIAQTATGLQITEFNTATNSDHQYDLMYTPRVYDLNKSTNANASVPLVFKHALSSVVFSSQKSNEDVDYHIKNVTVEGTFVQKANFNQHVSGATVDGKYVESEAPVWYPANAGTVVTYTPFKGIVNGANLDPFNVPIEAPEQFTRGTSALLLIPQTLPNVAKVQVTYEKITYPNYPDKTTSTKLETSVEIPLSAFSYLDNGVNRSVTEFEIGKRYIFRIAFGQNTRIYFEPSVTDWITEPTFIYTIQ